MTILGWLYWVVYQLLSLLATLIGIPLCYALATTRSWRLRDSKNQHYKRQVTAWKYEPLTLLWGNEEDGVTGAEWFHKANQTRTDVQIAFEWSALRNSANNMRLLPGAMAVLKKSDIIYRDTAHGFVATFGWRQCIEWRGFRIGWRITKAAEDGDYTWPIAERI